MSVMVEDPLIPALEAYQRGEYPPDPVIDRLKILSAKIERMARYRKIRRQHRGERWWTALECWKQATREVEHDYGWEWDQIDGERLVTHIERDGFDVKIELIDDDDRIQRGEFSDACHRPDAPLLLVQRCDPDERNDRHHDYFIPESGTTFRDVYESYRSKFWSLGRHEAWVQARRSLMEEVKRGANVDGETSQWGVSVTVSKNDVELGADSVWGIEFEHDAWTDSFEREAESYIRDGLDVIDEALGQAHDKLKELTA